MRDSVLCFASGKTGGRLDAKKGNHRTRRMGDHGSIGDGADRAGAASIETSTIQADGRNQKAFGRRLPIWNHQPASGPGKVQVISQYRSRGNLSRIWP